LEAESAGSFVSLLQGKCFWRRWSLVPRPLRRLGSRCDHLGCPPRGRNLIFADVDCFARYCFVVPLAVVLLVVVLVVAVVVLWLARGCDRVIRNVEIT
jgi:hypothetical protein